MVRVLCWAQMQSPPKKRGRGRNAKLPPSQPTFTILERVTLRQPAHKAVWDLLRRYGEKQSIVDSEFPADAMRADVIDLEKLSTESIQTITAALAERRLLQLQSSKDAEAGDLLAKRWDKLFEQELEWVALRNLLATALRKPAKPRRSGALRALLLISA
jgi:hypothetical protein